MTLKDIGLQMNSKGGHVDEAKVPKGESAVTTAIPITGDALYFLFLPCWSCTDLLPKLHSPTEEGADTGEEGVAASEPEDTSWHCRP